MQPNAQSPETIQMRTMKGRTRPLTPSFAKSATEGVRGRMVGASGCAPYLVAIAMAIFGARMFGQIPDSFSPVVGGAVNSITVQTDGKIVLGGNFTYINFRTQYGIAR